VPTQRSSASSLAQSKLEWPAEADAVSCARRRVDAVSGYRKRIAGARWSARDVAGRAAHPEGVRALRYGTARTRRSDLPPDGVRGSDRGPVDRNLSADGRTVQPLLGKMSAHEADYALEKLPAGLQQRLTAMSPVHYVADIHAPLVVLLHDRDDVVIPVGESRRLRNVLVTAHSASTIMSFVTERFNRIQPRGLARRIDPEEHADCRRDAEGQHDCLPRQQDCPSGDHWHQ